MGRPPPSAAVVAQLASQQCTGAAAAAAAAAASADGHTQTERLERSPVGWSDPHCRGVLLPAVTEAPLVRRG